MREISNRKVTMLTVRSPEKVGFSSERLNRIAPVMQGYIDRGQTGGILTLVERQGEIIHLEKCGYQDIAAQKPIEFDHIFRIYSMSKPITSLALLMLYEQALCHLHEPIHAYLPEFKDVKVWDNGKLVPPKSPATIRHLLNHTAGLTYGFMAETEVDKLYQGVDLFNKNQPLEEMVRKIAGLPLLYHPGEGWVYSVATDVVGRLVEVISGLSLADYLQMYIFAPLGLVDTAFSVAEHQLDRLTTCYGETDKEKLAVFDPMTKSAFRDVALHSGGGGLVSTLVDYLKFCRLIRNRGELDGVRLLGRKTWDLMGSNHVNPALFPLAIGEPMPGIGFGLGFSVTVDAAKTQALGSAGTLGWGGMASTTFWVDPVEELIAILMTQYVPIEPFNLQPDFRTLVYQALV
jgi:CubicO group peptidase (beta-lactamase class C family)